MAKPPPMCVAMADGDMAALYKNIDAEAGYVRYELSLPLEELVKYRRRHKLRGMVYVIRMELVPASSILK